MKLFVGGWGGSGTRVIQYWLHNMNVFVGDRQTPPFNWALDYIPILKPFLATLVNPDLLQDEEYMEAVRDQIKVDTEDCENWSLKHGHLMFNPEFCKTLYPDSKFLLVVRHGIDNVLNDCTLAEDFSHLGLNPPLPNKMENRISFWSHTHMVSMHDAQDLFDGDFQVMRLEDMVFETGAALSFLEEFTGLAAKPGARKACLDFVDLPPSIGRRFKTENDRYVPMDDLKLLYELGEEGLRTLGYLPW